MVALLRLRLSPRQRKIITRLTLAAGVAGVVAGMSIGNGPLIMVGLLLAGIANVALQATQTQGAPMDAQRTDLPGIGTNFRFQTEAGKWVGVIRHVDGRRELVVYAKDDPDTVRASLTLTAQEAHELGYILAARHPETLADGE